LMWDGVFTHREGRRKSQWSAKEACTQLFLFFAGSNASSSREFRLRLETDTTIEKGRDFNSRLHFEIDLAGVRGSSQSAARLLLAVDNLNRRLGQELTGKDLLDPTLVAVLVQAGLNVGITSARSLEKAIGQIPLTNGK